MCNTPDEVLKGMSVPDLRDLGNRCKVRGIYGVPLSKYISKPELIGRLLEQSRTENIYIPTQSPSDVSKLWEDFMKFGGVPKFNGKPITNFQDFFKSVELLSQIYYPFEHENYAYHKIVTGNILRNKINNVSGKLDITDKSFKASIQFLGFYAQKVKYETFLVINLTAIPEKHVKTISNALFNTLNAKIGATLMVEGMFLLVKTSDIYVAIDTIIDLFTRLNSQVKISSFDFHMIHTPKDDVRNVINKLVY